MQGAERDGAAEERGRGRGQANPQQMQVVEHPAGLGGPGLMGLGAHTADHAGLHAGPVVGGRGGRRQAQHLADPFEIAKLARARRAVRDMAAMAIMSGTGSSRS